MIAVNGRPQTRVGARCPLIKWGHQKSFSLVDIHRTANAKPTATLGYRHYDRGSKASETANGLFRMGGIFRLYPSRTQSRLQSNALAELALG